VPIVSIGEVNGKVYVSNGGIEKGQGRIAVQIFDSKNKKVAETVSESDGFYSYLGLQLGTYTIRLDYEQLEKLHYRSIPEEQVVQIKVSEEGTIVDGINFKISTYEIHEVSKTSLSDFKE
jgi:hypothetical protein